jgi:hypothetical protein
MDKEKDITQNANLVHDLTGLETNKSKKQKAKVMIEKN